MSKSLGNIINIREALKEWDAEVLRFFFVSYHYRSPADFSEEALKNAENSLKRLKEVKYKLEEKADENDEFNVNALDDKEKEYLKRVEEFKKKFEEAMDDDFNTPKALETIFDFIKATNKFLMEIENPDGKLCRYALNVFLKASNVLTLLQEEEKRLDEEIILKLAKKHNVDVKKEIKEIIETLLEIRKKAREEKNYQIADEIRDELRKAGIEIEDIGKETKWRIK